MNTASNDDDQVARTLIAEADARSPGTIDPAKSFELFKAHGLKALRAHIKAAETSLTEDDKELCEKYGIDEKAFRATRAREVERRKDMALGVDQVQLISSDLAIIQSWANDEVEKTKKGLPGLSYEEVHRQYVRRKLGAAS